MTKKILILASIVAVLMMSSCVILATDEIAVEAIVTLITVQDAGKTLKVDYQLKISVSMILPEFKQDLM
jgi:hypothetical protein